MDLLCVSADETARRVAVDVSAGRLPAQEGRHRIAELVVASPIISEAAVRAGARGQELADLVEMVRERLVNHVIEPNGSFFDMDRLATSSFDGWLRNTATAFARVRAGRTPKGMVGRTELFGEFPATVRGGAQREWLSAPAGASAEETVIEALAAGREAELVDIARRVHKQREGSLRFALAQALRAALGLPGLCVPSSPEDRAFVLAACEADRLLADRARRSVVESLREGGMPSRLDERLLALWDDMTAEQMARLDPYPAEATHVLVAGSLETMPKPSRVVVRAMRRDLREAGGRSMAWSALATRLLESWLARCCRAVSDFDDTSDAAAKAALKAAAAQAAAAWPAVVEEVCSWPGAPLGPGADQVERAVADACVRALADEQARRFGD